MRNIRRLLKVLNETGVLNSTNSSRPLKHRAQRSVLNYTLFWILDTSTRAHLREFYSKPKKLLASSAACEFLSKDKGMPGSDE